MVEGPETVLLLLRIQRGRRLRARHSAVLTITDNDVAGAVKLSAATFAGSEELGAAAITVSRSAGPPAA